ncbi:MAG: aminoacyl-tRNA hydrolase, partial [Pseudomonadota bacterium]|nr:aminoacyl-tRNA hydrolase [Pseudomonadota bacterium]
MLLIAGLGNPEAKYAKNRHNIGFMAVDALARRFAFPAYREKFHGLVSDGLIDNTKVLLLKPQTFMNGSGVSIAEAAGFYKLSGDQIIVFYDELDLPPGKLRIRRGGGLAGHNGLRSIKAHMGADFRRARLGFGHPGTKDRVTGLWVGFFPKPDSNWVGNFLSAI